MTDPNANSPLRWILLGTFLLAIPILLMVGCVMGSTSGTEFSPDDFSRRQFTYNQAPIVGWVLKKKVYADMTTPLEEELTMTGLVPTAVNRTKAWHLIRDSTFTDDFPSVECDAHLLTDFLDLSDPDSDYENYWIKWNETYPKCAKIFWPLVAEFARDQMYLKVADLMQFGMSLKEDNPNQFQPAINKILHDAYLELGSLDMELGRLERAKTRLEKAVKFGDSDSDSAKEALNKAKLKISESPSITSEPTETKEDGA